jgi:tetratricopeptide (TPR) repeat protein
MSLTYARRYLVGMLMLVLAGCATAPPPPELTYEPPPAALPRKVELSSVPYFPQEDFQCGPAALAMVLNHAGVTTDPAALKPEVYLPEREGSLQVEMAATVRRHGRVAYLLEPALGDVLEEVARGAPVVVLQNLALDWYPAWHYAVVIGYDLERKEIILRSGREQRQTLSFTTFQNTWARSAYWAMVALPPERVPATAREARYVSAVNALGKTGDLPAAHAAYQAAAERWPQSLGVQIGLGNVAYLMKRLDIAEQAFRRAVNDHPDSVAALNNLAQTLSDMGRDGEALGLVQKAVALGGPLQDIARSTQADIERKLKR